VLIYSCIEEEKGKDNKIGIKVQHTARSKDKVRKGQTSRIQHALNWGRYTPGSKLDALPSVRNIKREKKTSENTLKRRKTEKYNKEIHVNEQLLGCR